MNGPPWNASPTRTRRGRGRSSPGALVCEEGSEPELFSVVGSRTSWACRAIVRHGCAHGGPRIASFFSHPAFGTTDGVCGTYSEVTRTKASSGRTKTAIGRRDQGDVQENAGKTLVLPALYTQTADLDEALAGFGGRPGPNVRAAGGVASRQIVTHRRTGVWKG